MMTRVTEWTYSYYVTITYFSKKCSGTFSIEKGSNFSWNKISKKVAKIYKRMNAAAMSPQQSCSVKQDV